MIKFFRQLRYKNMQKNKTGRYLKYAIGEIVLVVIGILIALQINNLNEERKASAFELELLRSFKDGLLQDLEDIDYNMRAIPKRIETGQKIASALEADVNPHIDSIASWMSNFMIPMVFVHSNSAFETLKSAGINTIRDKELRNQIVGVLDSEYRFFLDHEDTYMDEIERGYSEIFPTRFKEAYQYDLTKEGYPGKIIPLDLKALKSDQEYLYYIRTMINRYKILLDFHYIRLRAKVVKLIKEIEFEISNMNGE